MKRLEKWKEEENREREIRSKGRKEWRNRGWKKKIRNRNVNKTKSDEDKIK